MIWWTPFVFFFLQIYLIYCCPFNNESEALIPDNINLFTEEHEVEINEEFGNSFGFGMWFMPIAQSLQIETQNLFQVTTIDNLIYFSGQSGIGSYYDEMALFFFSEGNLAAMISYSTCDFQNQWIFILFIILPFENSVIVQTSKKSLIQSTFEYIQIVNQQTLIFSVGNYEKNYQLLQGKLSKIICFTNFFYDGAQFDQFSQSCSIPSIINEPQNLYIIQGLSKFDQDQMMVTSFDQFGEIQPQLSDLSILYLLVRMSMNQFNYEQKNFGDDLFKLEVSLQYQQLKKLYKNYYGLILYLKLNIFKVQCHYFQYEFGRQNCKEEQILLQMYFFNEIGLIQEKIWNLLQLTPTNRKFYFFVRENDKNYNYLSASIYDLKFSFYYDDDQNFIPTCHHICKECNGPLKTNCISCFDTHHRYQTELSSCECKKNYYQYEKEALWRNDKEYSLRLFKQKIIYHQYVNLDNSTIHLQKANQNAYNVHNIITIKSNLIVQIVYIIHPLDIYHPLVSMIQNKVGTTMIRYLISQYEILSKQIYIQQMICSIQNYQLDVKAFVMLKRVRIAISLIKFIQAKKHMYNTKMDLFFNIINVCNNNVRKSFDKLLIQFIQLLKLLKFYQQMFRLLQIMYN